MLYIGPNNDKPIRIILKEKLKGTNNKQTTKLRWQIQIKLKF